MEYILTRRGLLEAAGIASIGLGLAACTDSKETRPSTSAQATAHNESDFPKITWALSSTIRSLDSAHGADGSTFYANHELLEGLVELDEKGGAQDLLAASWENPDPLTYVVRLRSNVQFWDGKPLTADDVAFSIMRNIDPAVASENANHFTALKNVTATGPLEATVKLKHPDPFFRLNCVYAPIIQKAYALAHASDLGTPSGLTMGTGPYKVESYSVTQGATFIRNDKYWGSKPKAAKLELKVISDPDQLRLAVQSGAVDGTFQQPLASSPLWDKLQNVNCQYYPSAAWVQLGLDITDPPFDDVHVRRAFAYALDREALVKSILHGRAHVAISPMDKSLWANIMSPAEVDGFYASLPNYSFDMAKSRAELAASGHPKGFKATIPYDPSRTQLGLVLQSLAQNLKPLGIELTAKAEPQAQWIAGLYKKGGNGPQIVSHTVYYSDPASYVTLNIGSNASLNYANYGDTPEMANLVKEALGGNPTVRKKSAMDIARKVAADVPYVPVFFQNVTIALNKKYVYAGKFNQWVYLGHEWASDIRLA